MFKALTGVRGAAAVLVMLYHYLVFQHLDDGRFSPFGPGYLAVDLFFILSGFLMAMNYRDSLDFNLIENAFAKLKALRRKAAERTKDALWAAIGRLVDQITPAECADMFAAADYDAT